MSFTEHPSPAKSPDHNSTVQLPAIKTYLNSPIESPRMSPRASFDFQNLSSSPGPEYANGALNHSLRSRPHNISIEEVRKSYLLNSLY